MSEGNLLGGLLAAGRSERFGAGNKLITDVGGHPLVTFAARQLQGAKCDGLALVADPEIHEVLASDFRLINPAKQNAGLGDNLAVLAAHAEQAGYAHLLVHLGDMPLVPAAHLQALADLASDDTPTVSLVENRFQVPCCFPRQWFGRLTGLAGDKGAGRLFTGRNCVPVKLSPEHALDVDSRDDLARLRALLRNQSRL